MGKVFLAPVTFSTPPGCPGWVFVASRLSRFFYDQMDGVEPNQLEHKEVCFVR